MNNEPVAYVNPIWMNRPDLVMSHQLEIGKLFARTQFKNYVPLYTHQYERPHNTVLVPCDKLAEMQAEIEALKQIIDANNLNQNIGQFVKPTNEPVAYGKYIENAKMWLVVELNADMPDGYIPLYTHPVKEYFEDEPQAEELHEIMQSNTHPVEEQDESFDRTASHMAGEYVSHPVKELTEKEKWLTEIDVKQQALKKIIDWLILEHDTLACTSYPLKKAQEK